MTIYVASSWKNPKHPEVVKALREAGHNVYDYRNPGYIGETWDDIDPAWHDWTVDQCEESLKHSKMGRVFWCDFNVLEESECVVGLIPFGASVGMVLGFALARGKKVILLHTDPKPRPDLMLKMIPNRVTTVDDLLQTLHAMR